MDNLYLLYDVKSGLYSAPFLANTDNEVRRMVLDMALHGGDNLVSQHPEDFEVYYAGTYEKRTGVFDIEPCRDFVLRVSELIETYRTERQNKVVSISGEVPNNTPNSCQDETSA